MKKILLVFCILVVITSTADAAQARFPSVYDLVENKYRMGEFEAAMPGLKEWAEKGDAVSQYYLGHMYENGQGTPKDYGQAFAWYSKAAQQNYAEAQNNLGNMYLFGNGTKRDVAQARHWYSKAANQGNASAQSSLGYSYRDYLPIDKLKAVFWLEKAAAHGDGFEQYRLADIYESDKTVQNDVKAAYWMRKAANQGVADAQNYLGRFYRWGIGVPKDYAKALYWFERASNQGHEEAPYSIAQMYEHGRVVPQDSEKATQWYCTAAKQVNGNYNAIFELTYRGPSATKCLTEVAERGVAPAQHQLGYWFDNPQGDAHDAHDYVNAVKWYRKAAEQGYSSSLDALGDLYARGLGVPQDPVIAQVLYILGKKGKSTDGTQHSSRIREPLSEIQISEAKSLAASWKVDTPLPEKSETLRLPASN